MKFLHLTLMALMVLGPASLKAIAATSEMDYQTGLAYYEQKQYPEALKLFRQAVEADPNNWLAYQLIGYCLSGMGNFAEALDACDKSLKIHSDNLTLRDYAEKLRAKVAPVPARPIATATPAISPNRDWRADKKFGLYLSGIGDPALCYGGLNLAYNVTSFLRLTGGVGYLQEPTYTYPSPGSSGGAGSISGISAGAGAKFLVPGWEFSPVVGLNLSELFINGFPPIGDAYVNGYPPSEFDIAFFYPNIGFDYQAKDGLNLGFGTNILFLLALPPNVYSDVQVVVIPYLNLGMFF